MGSPITDRKSRPKAGVGKRNPRQEPVSAPTVSIPADWWQILPSQECFLWFHPIMSNLVGHPGTAGQHQSELLAREERLYSQSRTACLPGALPLSAQSLARSCCSGNCSLLLLLLRSSFHLISGSLYFRKL
jgi:hypothetical protein